MTDDEYISELIKYPGNRKPVTYEEIRDKVIPDNGWTIEASPDYNPNTGRLETNSKPVGMFTESSSGPRPVATKWTIKEED